MKESTIADNSVLQESEAALTDLDTIEGLGYPTQRLRLTSDKIEMHLNALRRGNRLMKLWHTTWLTVHCTHYQQLREQMA